MSLLAICFLLVASIALIAVPRRLAPIPLLLGCCYMTMGQGIDVGGISLPIFRILLLVGVARVMVRGERLTSPLNTIDKLVIVFGSWIVFASFFHKGGDGSGPVYAAGMAFNLVA